MKLSIRDLDLRNKRVFIRVDFNVPLKGGAVSDDTRLRAALPTISYLRDKGARVVLLSHLGRPKGGPDPQFSLRQVVRDLERLLGAPVEFIEDPVQGVAATRRLPRGGVALVENTRFWPGEERNDQQLAATSAPTQSAAKLTGRPSSWPRRSATGRRLSSGTGLPLGRPR